MRRGAQWGLIGVCLLAGTGATALGFWQLGRLTARRAANAVALAGRALPEVPLNSVAAHDSLRQRRATATGVFDHGRAILLRGRIERDAPGVHLIVPLRLTGRGDAILVHRGFVPANDAVRPDTSIIDVTPGELTVTGVLLPIPEDPASAAPLGIAGDTTWHRLDRAAIGARIPYPILDLYLFETVKEARADPARPWPVLAAVPALDDGPHLSYMLQWFGIAAAAMAFAVIFGRGGAAKGGWGG